MSVKRAKPGYKLTPCGEIPQEWECVPLGTIFAERAESGFNDLPLLAITGDRGVVPRDSLNRRDSSKEDKSAYLRVLPDDIAYNTMRMWQGVSGLSEHEGIVSPAYTVCRPLKGLIPSFAPHLLKHPANIRLFHRHSQGLVDDTLNLKFHHFEKIHVALPSTKEQRRIATILKDVDVALLNGRTVIEQRRCIRDDVVIARVKSMKSPLKKLGELITSIDAGKSPECPDHPAGPNQCGVIKGGAITSNGFCPSENKFIEDVSVFDPRMEIQPGDLLITRGSGSRELVGMSCLATRSSQRLFLSDLVLRLRLVPQLIHSGYLDIILKLPIIRSQIERHAVGSNGIKKINRSLVRELTIPLPSLIEQQEIVSITEGFQRSFAAEEQKLASLERVKTELARRLLTGELRVKP
ncbi:MAG: restriction endonuclease subunit S [Opitutaceae bacterium]|jgi:type I restriction enzyme S subunit